jgi:hypothetical protein
MIPNAGSDKLPHRTMKKSGKNKNPRQNDRPSVLIMHVMTIEENFERCAYRLHEMLKDAQQNSPDARRILCISVDGHRDEAGDYDRDAWEIINHFIPEILAPYLSEYWTPSRGIQRIKRQRNDIAPLLEINPPPEKDTFYDVEALRLRSREQEAGERNSPPSVKAIADYIGIHPPRCLICGGTPVQRAHALPRSLGGSYDVRNFALLCKPHHDQAPDIADAEAFWAWIDYMGMRNSRGDFHPKHPEMLGVRVPIIKGTAEENARFSETIRRELIELYGWGQEEFDSFTWALNVELHKVLGDATGYHFGIIRKASTHAWAYDVALRRTGKKPPPYFPIY